MVRFRRATDSIVFTMAVMRGEIPSPPKRAVFLSAAKELNALHWLSMNRNGFNKARLWEVSQSFEMTVSDVRDWRFLLARRCSLTINILLARRKALMSITPSNSDLRPPTSDLRPQVPLNDVPMANKTNPTNTSIKRYSVK